MAVNQTQGVVLAIFGASAGGHLSSLDANATANGLGSLAQDLSAAAGLILGVDLSSNATFTSTVLDNLGVTSGEARTVADAYFTSQLAAGTSRGQLIADAVNFLLGSPEVPFDTVANTFQSTVSEAVSWSQGAGSNILAVSQLRAQQDNAGGGDGSTFTLTTASTDVVNGTAGSDTFDATSLNSLQTGDVVIDSSSTDNDTLNATSSAASAAPRLSGIENVNVTGPFLTTGLDVANLSGTSVLTFDTELTGGTATVANAYSINAASIVAEENVTTVDITSSSAGTRDNINVTASGATTLNITGAAGADEYTVTSVADESTVTLATVTTNDAVTITVPETVTVEAAGVENLNLIANQDSTITISDTAAATSDTDAGEGIAISGSGNVTLKVADATALSGVGLSNSGTGTVTVELTTMTDGETLNEVLADIVELNGANDNDTYTFNQDSTVVLNADMSTTAGDITNIDIDNIDADLAVGAGTLSLTVSESQSSIIAVGDDATTSNAGAVVLTSLVDEASDTADSAVLTLLNLDLNTNSGAAGQNDTLVIRGSDDLTISTLTNKTGGTVSAAEFTGDLTIGEITAATSFFGGSGKDTLTVTTNSIDITARLGAGDDKVTLGDGTDGAFTVYGEDGADTITTGTGADKVYGGDGDDTFETKTGADTATGGAGADTYILSVDDAVAATNTLKITDFVIGEDILQLKGTTTDTTIDVSSVTPSSAGLYTIASGDFEVTLTGNTATDLSSSVQLGTDKNPLVLVDASTVTAGSLDDVIEIQESDSATLTLGDGNDVVLMQVASGTASVTVTDFVLGTDKIVLTGSGVDTSLDLTETQSGAATGAYTVGTAGGASDEASFTLTGITETDLTEIVQLGSKNNVFTQVTAGTTVAGDFDDYITVVDAGGANVTPGKGKDIINLGATTSAANVLVIADGDSLVGSHDEVSEYTISSSDVLDLDSTNLATVIGSTQVGDITGVTVSSGVVTAWAGIANTINADTLDDAIAFLQANIGGTDTVAFEYTADENDDGDTTDAGETSTFVYQSGTNGTLVELIGITGITALATAQGANTIEIN